MCDFCFVFYRFLCGARSINHISVFLLRAPSNDFDGSVSCCNMSARLLNMVLYPLSQSFDMDNSALFSMSGKMALSRCCWNIRHVKERSMRGSIVISLGSFTVIPGAHFLMVVKCVLKPKNGLCTLTEISFSLLAMTSIANAYLDVVVDKVVVLLGKFYIY